MENNIIIYQTQDGKTKIDVKLKMKPSGLHKIKWLSCFNQVRQILASIFLIFFEEGELDENSVVRNFRITANDGKNYNTKHYNLDVIISVGYRVKSLRGTQFRIWATQTLKEYMIKRFCS